MASQTTIIEPTSPTRCLRCLGLTASAWGDHQCPEFRVEPPLMDVDPMFRVIPKRTTEEIEEALSRYRTYIGMVQYASFTPNVDPLPPSVPRAFVRAFAAQLARLHRWTRSRLDTRQSHPAGSVSVSRHLLRRPTRTVIRRPSGIGR